MHSLPTQQTISPNLAKALNNPALREASYSLPDGTIVIDPKKPKSPNLSAALQNPYLKSASYTLPDGTIIIDPRKPASPNLQSVLQNSSLLNASLSLPGGIQDPNRPMSPNLAKVSDGYRQRVLIYTFLSFLIRVVIIIRNQTYLTLAFLTRAISHRCVLLFLAYLN